MQTRTLGRTGRTVSVIGLGTWQLGADWGDVDEADALAVLDAARDAGVTFFDTADVYGDGRSETLIGAWLREHPDCGRHASPRRWAAACRRSTRTTRSSNFRAWTDRSRANLGVDTLDLVQLHCPPTAVYGDDARVRRPRHPRRRGRHRGLRRQRRDGRRGAHRDRPARTSRRVQIILNAFRLKPLDEVLPAAARGRRRHHRAGAARERAALRPLHARHRRSPRTTTAPSTGTARPSTSARPSRASTTTTGVRAARRVRASSPAARHRMPARPGRPRLDRLAATA